MRSQLNQEMLWPTNSLKQIFDTQYEQQGISLYVIVSKSSILAVQGRRAFGPTGLLQGISSTFVWDLVICLYQLS